jgi:hypothetical protein
MRGAIEARRDQRAQLHGGARSRDRRAVAHHPRLEAALASDLRRTRQLGADREQARADAGRWADEGGSVAVTAV